MKLPYAFACTLFLSASLTVLPTKSAGHPLLPDLPDRFETDTTIVIATLKYEATALELARAMDGNAVALDISLREAFRLMANRPNIVGIIEVDFHYHHSARVNITCWIPSRAEQWQISAPISSFISTSTKRKILPKKALKKMRGRSCPERSEV